VTDYGQRAEMEHPTMVGTLAAQAEMIWPLERPILDALGLGGAGRVLDLACGTGEIAGRVAAAWPGLEVTGLDLFPGHLDVARRRFPSDRHPNLAFVVGDAHATPFETGGHGAVFLRHVLHALPDPGRVLGEARRILRPGGLLWALAEDYQGLLFDAEDEAAGRLFLDAREPLRSRGTDLFHGRRAWRDVREAGFSDVQVHAITIDTANTPREPFARMLRFWRDGYVGLIAACMGRPEGEIRARFDALVATVEDPSRYAGWWLPAVSARG
jgi:ubiquinone/menaquinone biosynthesis C-methylase UbiE